MQEVTLTTLTSFSANIILSFELELRGKQKRIQNDLTL